MKATSVSELVRQHREAMREMREADAQQIAKEIREQQATQARMEVTRHMRQCECGDEGKHACYDRPAWRCDACELATVRKTFDEERARWLELVTALDVTNDDDRVRYVTEVQVDALAEIKRLKEAPKPRRVLIEHKGQDWNKAKLFVSPLRDLTGLIEGSKGLEKGAGLAARYPDATPAAKPLQEPVTCDVGADWDD